MPAQRPKLGPLVLVIDSALAQQYRPEYVSRGAQFVHASQISSADFFAKTLKAVWIDASLDTEVIGRLRSLIPNKDGTAVYHTSSSLVTLRDMLERKLRPRPEYKSDNGGLSTPREDQPAPVVVNCEAVRIRELEASLARMTEQVAEVQKKLDRSLADLATSVTENARVKDRNKGLSATVDDLHLELELAKEELVDVKNKLRLSEGLRERLEKQLQAAKIGGDGMPLRHTKRNITLLRNSLTRLDCAIKGLDEFKPKIPSAALLKEVELGHLTFEARCLEAQFVTVMKKAAVQELPKEDMDALAKLQDMLKEHTAKLREFLGSTK